MYEVKILGVLEYYKYVIAYFGIRNLLELTDSGYPKIFSLGWCLHSRKEIIVCRIGDYELRKWHELGHSVGFGHTKEHGHVMHPWGIFRGCEGIDEIKDTLESQQFL